MGKPLPFIKKQIVVKTKDNNNIYTSKQTNLTSCNMASINALIELEEQFKEKDDMIVDVDDFLDYGLFEEDINILIYGNT